MHITHTHYPTLKQRSKFVSAKKILCLIKHGALMEDSFKLISLELWHVGDYYQ